MMYTALVGHPVAHSVSSQLFGLFADKAGIDYAHLKINVSPKPDDLRQAVNALKTLGFAGLNVTSPFKHKVIQYLDDIGPFAHDIGAVNAIQIENGKLVGSNTDCLGAITTIELALGRTIEPSDEVLVFGTGGAAKALVGGLKRRSAKISVCYREPIGPKAEDFIRRFDGSVRMIPFDLDQIADLIAASKIICNATSVGMSPVVSACILPDNVDIPQGNEEKKVFFDVVYNPIETRFLQRAKEAGHIAASGLDMMIYQGAAAFKIWTAADVSQEAIVEARHLLMTELLSRCDETGSSTRA